MSPDSMQLTVLLQRWAAGDPSAMDAAVPAAAAELRRIAAARLREDRAGHTLQATELVNEAYLRLLGGTGYSFESRGHFFALASHLMRQILIDYARKYRAAKPTCSRCAGPAFMAKLPSINSTRVTDSILATYLPTAVRR
jgi:RNA polymerase sigma factor (TIGR02999 family)